MTPDERYHAIMILGGRSRFRQYDPPWAKKVMEARDLLDELRGNPDYDEPRVCSKPTRMICPTGSIPVDAHTILDLEATIADLLIVVSEMELLACHELMDQAHRVKLLRRVEELKKNVEERQRRLKLTVVP